MKRSIRLHITGSLQSMFFDQFIKDNAVAHSVKGYVRHLREGVVEIFLEGNNENVEAMILICTRGPKYAQIRSVEQKEEKFQDFKEFKILGF
ncbi:MAG: acylphosphatase [Nanoarchaeota archaeon]|nr:acylphosphatase [Nanoarchaeota archaeon]